MFDALAAPGFLESVNARAKQLSEGLQALSAKYGMTGERGLGLLRALVMDRDDGPAAVEAAHKGRISCGLCAGWARACAIAAASLELVGQRHHEVAGIAVVPGAVEVHLRIEIGRAHV